MGTADVRWRLETDDGRLIAGAVAVADSPWARFRGLMFRPQLPPGEGLALRPCKSIHMFFMRFPLDVAFVDGEGNIRHALHGIRPWRASRVVRGAKAAIELPAGTLRDAGLDRGSRVQLVRNPAPAPVS